MGTPLARGGFRMPLTFFKPAPDSLVQHHYRPGKSRWLMAFNLMWSLWVFGDALFDPALELEWRIATSISFPLFLLLYALVHVRPRRELCWYALSMAVLGWLVMPFNHSGGTSYIIFSCAYLAFDGTVRQALAAIVGILALFALEAILLAWPWQVIAMMAAIAASVGGGNVAFRVTWKREADLRLSHEEVRKLAATAERERIGRDLHDLLGHTLSLITLKLELSRRLIDRDPAAARVELAEAEDVARHALAEVRSAVTGIRATDLAAELASARLLLECSAVTLTYEPPPSLSPDVERPLALVLREAATNIARHARATRAEVGFVLQSGRLRMRITDDGRGGASNGAEGNGLAGMRERIRALGGSLALASARGGTTLEIEVPLPAASLVSALSALPARPVAVEGGA
jgi:two-component system sensor histidine kinase DesK